MTKGRYGVHGGQYIPETLMNAVLELEQAYEYYKNDPQFNKELQALYHDYANRPSLCGKNDEGPGRREDLFKTRGLEPHRLAQN